MQKGYFFLGDFLGFSNIVKNCQGDELNQRAQDWVDLVKEAAAKAGLSQFQLFSDTVFASAGPDKEHLGQLVTFAQYLLNYGVPRSVPVRGAITYGTFEWGNFTYGEAVVTAHLLEAGQDWIGVGCASDIPHASAFYRPDKLVVFPIPMKEGPITLYPAVTWPVPSFDKLIKYLGQKGLHKPGQVLEWDWARKVDYTIQFRLYLYVLSQTGQSGSEFHGFLPIQSIELNFPMKHVE